MKFIHNFTLLFLIIVQSVHSWDSQQLEVFDVVEEIKVNFYEFLKVSQDASLLEIKSAFRHLSLELHPDKNKNENADEQFRNLVSVYEVLKDSNKRKYYDEVLINGLPNWRSAVYYYRHVRKIGLLELCLFLFVLFSIGQYLVAWASYFEKQYTLAQVKGRKQKKLIATIEIPKPSLVNTLPVQVPKLIISLLKSTPLMLMLLKETLVDKLKKEEEESSEEEPTQEIRTARKRKTGFVVPDGPTFEPIYLADKQKSLNIEDNVTDQVVTIVGGLWTDDDLAELAQLISRYPGGTSNRWGLISEATGRSVAEVTYMANKLKTSGYRIASQENKTEEEIRTKVKTKGTKVDETSNVSNWSQEQQKAMENALAKFPKGCIDRWDCIADCVPGKTKEECILRFKYLVDLVKKQKETKSLE